jgi:hypothetical protein
MRAYKMREESAEKNRDEHFNNIRPVILMEQEWRVKEKADTPAPPTSDDEAPLIKDRSPPPTSMVINMMFMLPAEYMGALEEIVQMCLSPM